MSSRAWLTLGSFAVILTACAYNPPPVPMRGPADAIQLLAGTWEGDYLSPATGRSGTVRFQLEAGADTAFGEIWMYPSTQGRPEPYMPGRPAHVPPPPEPLRIDFVRCEGESVRGILIPYHDPECDCTVVTEFRGVLDGDRIRGEFTSWRGEGERPVTGTWEVKRRESGGP